jgi:hypothetical protein
VKDLVIYTGGKLFFVKANSPEAGGAILAFVAYELVEKRQLHEAFGILTSYALVKLPGSEGNTPVIMKPDIAYEPTADTVKKWRDMIRAQESGIQTPPSRM